MAAAAIESLAVIKFGTNYRFWRSPQQIVDCSSAYGNNGCNQGLASYAFRYTMDYGLNYENNYAYEGVTRACRRKSVSRDCLHRVGMLPLCTSICQAGSVITAALLFPWTTRFGHLRPLPPALSPISPINPSSPPAGLVLSDHAVRVHQDLVLPPSFL